MNKILKILIILMFILSNGYVGFSQDKIFWLNDPYTFCYTVNNNEWQTSHGSPYSDDLYLRLETSYVNGTRLSEGVFAFFSFSKDKKYRIKVYFEPPANNPGIDVYGANNLYESITPNCELSYFPSNHNNKDQIGKKDPCLSSFVEFPSSTTLWNPDKDYAQLWISSINSSQDATSSLHITKIEIYDHGKVNPPGKPMSLYVSSTTSTSATIKWNPSSQGDYDIDKYNIYRNGTLLGSVNASMTLQYTINNLVKCTSYTIQVEAVDKRKNVSPKASVTTNLLEDVVVLQSTINLANYTSRKHVVEADNEIIFNPGFSVEATTAQDCFIAMIGCSSSRELREEDFYFEEDSTIYFSQDTSFYNDTTFANFEEDSTIYFSQDTSFYNDTTFVNFEEDTTIYFSQDTSFYNDTTFTEYSTFVFEDADEQNSDITLKNINSDAGNYEEITLANLEKLSVIVQSDSDLIIFPNPNCGTFTLKIIGEINPYTIEIFNSSGSMIGTANSNDEVININRNDLNAGIYYVKLTMGDKIIVKKVIVQ